MTREHLIRIEQLCGQMAAVIREGLDAPTISRQLRNGLALLEYSPLTMTELPAWFATLTREQLDAVWVQAIVDAAARDAAVSIRDLAMALIAVRDWPSGQVIPVELPHVDATLEAEATREATERPRKQPHSTPRRRADNIPAPKADEIVAAIRTAAPNAGDRVAIKSLFAGPNDRTRAREVISRFPDEFEIVRQPQPGGAPFLVVVRRGVPTSPPSQPPTAGHPAGDTAP